MNDTNKSLNVSRLCVVYFVDNVHEMGGPGHGCSILATVDAPSPSARLGGGLVKVLDFCIICFILANLLSASRSSTNNTGLAAC